MPARYSGDKREASLGNPLSDPALSISTRTTVLLFPVWPTRLGRKRDFLGKPFGSALPAATLRCQTPRFGWKTPVGGRRDPACKAQCPGRSQKVAAHAESFSKRSVQGTASRVSCIPSSSLEQQPGCGETWGVGTSTPRSPPTFFPLCILISSSEKIVRLSFPEAHPL